MTKGFAVALLLLVLPAAADEAWLSEAEMKAIFTGQTVTGFYTTHLVFTETYHANGRTNYWDPVTGADAAQWHVTKQGFCTFHDNDMGGCFVVRRVSENCFEDYLVESQRTGPLDPDTRKPFNSQFWLNTAPSTCMANVS
jgi:hypothetical protein